VTRLVYGIYSRGGLVGGHKVILRHVEALRAMGFDAVGYTGRDNAIPAWFEHDAPILRNAPVTAGQDILILPDDALNTIRQVAPLDYRVFILVQNHFYLASASIPDLDRFPPDRMPHFIAVSPTIERLLRRLYPQAQVSLVPAFADERIFKPGPERQAQIAYSPRKRPLEADAVRALFGKLHPEKAGLGWAEATDLTELQVAALFARSSQFLSLSRLEGLGMTPLEAMASGCLCAGFLGVAGSDFATPENGFWAPEDDCVAAADALAQAAEIVAAGGPELKRRLEAGYETARAWSHAAFVAQLEAFWMAQAPDARLKSGPLARPAGAE
jgi:glycosyltransferase involved in cell wall biosynthesis